MIFLHEIRASSKTPCPWDEEEKTLWMKNLLFLSAWADIKSYIDRKNLWDNLFTWGIGKYWRDNGNVFYNAEYGLPLTIN